MRAGGIITGIFLLGLGGLIGCGDEALIEVRADRQSYNCEGELWRAEVVHLPRGFLSLYPEGQPARTYFHAIFTPGDRWGTYCLHQIETGKNEDDTTCVTGGAGGVGYEADLDREAMVIYMEDSEGNSEAIQCELGNNKM